MYELSVMNRLSLFETPLWMTELDLDLNSLENKIKLFSDETESKKLSNVGGYQGHNFHDESLYNSIANCIPVNKNKPLGGAGGAHSVLFFDLNLFSKVFKSHFFSPKYFKQPTIDLT